MNRVNFLKRGEFYEWLSKSNFSFKIGASHPAELLQRAACHHYDALCLNDYDGVYGLARLYRDWRDLDRDSTYRKKLKLHYAAEIHFRSDHEAPLLFQDTLVLVVQNLSGYRNLCQIVSRMHEGQKTGSFIRWEDFVSSDLRDLVAIAPMRGLVQYKEESVWKRRCRELKELFSERFFMAMTKLHSPAEDAPLRSWMQFSQKERIHPLISQDVFFHAPERKNLHDLLQAIRLNRPVQTLGRHCFSNAERHLHGLEEIWSVYGSFDFFDQALGASRELSQSCHFSLQELRYHYPREMIPEGMTAQDYLEFLTWQKAKERFGKNLPEKIRLLLARELDLIEELEFADYFLTVWDIVRWAREQSILCQGRGSAANSAVCFVLGVTAIDPSAFDLLFERFISKERGDPPDIDIDFEHERREEVLQYVYERYGRARAAMVANVITYRGKGALRATGKALGIPEIVLSRVSDVYGSRFVQTNLPKKNKSPERDEEKQLKHQSKHQPKDQTKNQPKNEAKNEQSRSFLIIERMKKECEEDVDLGVLDRNLRAEMIAQKRGGFYWSLWAEMAEQLKGFPNHMGIHSGGFVLSDRPLNEIVAQEIATMPGRTVIQWSKEDMEALGFHKIDLLSLGMLSAVRKTFDYIDQCYGKRLKLEDIPPDDLATYSMIQRADTVGVFQIESRAQMQMLPRLRPRNFYDLVIEVAIIRPGPLQGKVVHPYLKRRHGQEAVSYAHESLKPILAKTLGVPIFQEQAMRIAMAVGDFTPGEANELRKNIGAWNMKDFSRNLKPWLLKLERGMKQKGIKRIFIDQILNEMKVFANYGFPESHAASFALIAYVSSFLKCHYPAAFICGLLNSQPMGFYRPAELVETAKRAGVRIRPICINHSQWDNTLEPEILKEHRPKTFALRLGLRNVSGLSRSGAEKIVEARRAMPERAERPSFLSSRYWLSLSEFTQSVTVFRDDMTALAAANAFASLGIKRKGSIWAAEKAPLRRVLLEEKEKTMRWKEESLFEKVARDYEAFSLTLSQHPAQILRTGREQGEAYWSYSIPVARLTLAKDLEKLINGERVFVFGMKVVMQGPPSAKGMKFFTLSDETGFFNLVFTPQIYDQYGRLAEKTAYLCVRGRLQKANEHHSILVYEVFAPMKSNNVLVFEDNDKTSIKEKSANKNTKKAEGKIPKKEAETKELSLVSYPELQKPRRFH